ncbi:MAG: cupin [Hyphomicrobiales bacterium]
MRIIKADKFKGHDAWDAMDIEQIGEATIRLHWTNQPYKWHINDGPEVFVVLVGTVNMHIRLNGEESIHKLSTGDVFHAENGDEHVAHPVGEAHVLVIERAGSV